MKTAVITGASRGIGRAIAHELAAHDYRLWLVGRDRNALEQTQELVAAKGGEGAILTADLSQPEEILRVAGVINHDSVDLLVNNAGLAQVNPLADITLDEWQEMMAVNVTAPFLLTQALAPRLRKGAAIVNILSIAAKNGISGWSAYCASKFALEGFTQSIREELRAQGIRVINIYPSATDTQIWDGISGDWPRRKMLPPEEVAGAVIYALSRPESVLVENITLGGIDGRL